ncbi:MAG TPA: aldehyde ferredoxin oxidoreductase family protein [Firmicutes bacterium]|nr:aldehyde ferredoxin oxidoreductase family protein [Bacillota bacterium]
MYGYAGKVLRVDLTSGRVSTEPLDESMAREWLGGRGFVAKKLWDEVTAGTEPFSPENKLIMAAGPLTGTLLPSSGKLHSGCLSPASGGYGDSNMGGHFAAELKYAGYDMIIIEGRAGLPSILVIDDDKVEIRGAGDIWGKGCIASEVELKRKLGDDFQIAVVGPAAERLVRFACISHDFGRQSGRAGVGAVMGYKNLKAIAVRGSKAIPLKDPALALKKGEELFEAVFAKPGYKEWTPYGTAGVTDWVNEVGAFPTRNFKSGYFNGYKGIDGQALRDRIRITDKGCFCCPIPCGKYSTGVVGGKRFFVEGPEYETIAMIGGDLMLPTIEEVAYANSVCDDLGLDSISAGSVAAFAIECYENGIISKEDIGRHVQFGDVDSAVYLFEQMAYRRGIGDLLAEGVKRAADRLGRGAERFAIHVKGLEVTGYEPRNAAAMLLSYMTADIGAHHNRSWAITYDIAKGRLSTEGKAEWVIQLQHTRPLFDTLGICRLPWVEIGFETKWYEEIFPVITGLDYSWEQLLNISERIWNLTRCISIRHIPGFGRKDDMPPVRFVEEPIPDGPTAGGHLTMEDAQKLLDDYYRLRGWDSNGHPTREKLQQLGLDFVKI